MSQSDDEVPPTLPAPTTGEPRGLEPADPGHYKVTDEVARGGLGRILRAIDRKLERPVAIKELIDPSDESTARFAREALLTARLQHPAIVPVYDVGVWPTGAPFFAMKLVSGRSLEQVIRETLTLGERLALLPHVLAVANALAYAHEQKIIHRDVKPANVLVGAHGETVVVDWGLAKDLGETSSPGAAASATPSLRASRSGEGGPVELGSTGGRRGLGDAQTIAGSVMGTPAYMPPEQALANPVDERADVYSLGAILYHVLGGEPPYAGTSSQDVLLKVIHDPPEPLEKREPSTPAELVAIVTKAMAREPRDRYRDAGALAEDLRRFLAGQLVGAHRYSTGERVVRWMKRYRAALVVACAMLAVGAALAVVGVRRIVRERDRARAAQTRAEKMEQRADERGDELALAQARAQLDRDPRRSLAWLKRLSARFRRWDEAADIAEQARRRGVSRRLIRDERPLEGLALSPDGTLIFSARAVDGGLELGLTDPTTGQARHLVERPRETPADPRVVAFAPDGALVAFAGADDTLRLWDVKTGAARALRGHTDGVTAIAFELRGARIASGSSDGTLRVWRRDGIDATQVVKLDSSPTEVAFSPDGARIAAGCDDGSLHLVDAERGSAIRVAAHASLVTGVAFVDDARVATASHDGSVRLWDAATGKPVQSWTDETVSITALASDRGRIAAGRVDGAVVYFDGAGGARVLEAHGAPVTGVEFVGATLVSSSADRSLRAWDVHTDRDHLLIGHEGEVRFLAVSAPARRVVSGGSDRAIRVWQLDDLTPEDLLPDDASLRTWLRDYTDATLDEDRDRAASRSRNDR